MATGILSSGFPVSAYDVDEETVEDLARKGATPARSPAEAAEGKFAAPMGDRRFAFVDVRDVARVAAAVLTLETHAGATYVVSGPQALSYGDAARTIGDAIGKEVAYEPAKPQVFCEDLVAERGLPRWRAEDLAFIASASKEGEGELVTSGGLSHHTPPRKSAFSCG